MKTTKKLIAAMLCAALTACGPKEDEIETTVKITSLDESRETEIPEVENKEGTLAELQTNQSEDVIYEDNFAVDASEAALFADKIKAAVAERDLEALADLTAFPVYVGISDSVVETREEFISLGSEKVFTPGLLESVEGADTSNLTPSMAGFSISKDGKSNINFGVVDGRLAINGINYQ